MISPTDIATVLEGYDPKNIRIGSLGGHSALDVCRGAKREGFETVVVVQKGREKTYSQYYKTRGDKGCVDHVIVVDNFGDIVLPEIQEQLRKLNVVFVHSRYFWVYCDFNKIENDFLVPILGSRELVRKLQIKGINFAELTLHVGLGTFRPIEVEDLTKHKMDSEEMEIPQSAVDVVNQTKDAKKKIMVTHTPPTSTKMEKLSHAFIGTKNVDVASKGVEKAVRRFKPDLLLCSHLHEAEGIEERLDKTLVINVGRKGKIIEI